MVIIDKLRRKKTRKFVCLEIIEIIKNTDNILPDDIGTKQWYTQPPTDEESVDSLEVPVINTINRMICKIFFFSCD